MLVFYLRRCGINDDLPKFEQMLKQFVAAAGAKRADPSPMSMMFNRPPPVPEIFRLVYEAHGRALVPALQQALGDWHPDTEKFSAIQSLRADQRLPYLRSLLSPALSPEVQSRAAKALADLGEPDGLIPATKIATTPSQEPSTRGDALQTFHWFRGPALRRFLLNELKTSEPVVRSDIFRALRWYDDDEVLGALLDGVKDRNRNRRLEAVRSLAYTNSRRTGTWLRQHLDSLAPEAKVYAGRALQLMQPSEAGEVFLRFVREQSDASTDYSAVVEAVVGLEVFYRSQPAAVVIDALRDGRREVARGNAGLDRTSSAKRVVELLKHLVSIGPTLSTGSSSRAMGNRSV